MNNIHGEQKSKTLKAAVGFTEKYFPAKIDTNGNVTPVTAHTDVVYTVVQNKPLQNQGASCPQPGDEIKFIIGAGGLTPGQSAKLSDDSGEFMKLEAITINLAGPNFVLRTVRVEQGGAEDEIGTGVLMLDYVPIT